jgi:hypothetical protein
MLMKKILKTKYMWGRRYCQGKTVSVWHGSGVRLDILFLEE